LFDYPIDEEGRPLVELNSPEDEQVVEDEVEVDDAKDGSALKRKRTTNPGKASSSSKKKKADVGGGELGEGEDDTDHTSGATLPRLGVWVRAGGPHCHVRDLTAEVEL